MDFKTVFKRFFTRDNAQPVQSDEDPWLYQNVPTHPAVGLDVSRVYALFSAAEQGDIEAQSDLFTDMEEHDGHLFSELSKRKRALLTLPFAVKPPPDASDAEKKIAADADWALHNLPGLRDMMQDMLDAIGHGFACIEIKWGQNNGLWLPQAFLKRPARAFTLPQSDLNCIRLNQGGTDGEPLWDMGWIVHKHKSKSGPVAQSGLFRVLVWTYLFKNLSARDWAQFLNLYGLPFRIGKYDSTMDDAERMNLLRGIRMLGREAGGIIPKESEIQLVTTPPGQSAPFFNMIDWCEKVQSKVILGGTLTSQADGKTSTNALGNIHNEVRHDLLAGDALAVADTLTHQLLWPILALNGQYDPAHAPRIEFDTREAVDLSTLMDVVIKAQSAGFAITPQWLSDKSGIPLPKDGESVLKPMSRQLQNAAALSQAMQARLAALSMPVTADAAEQLQLDAAPAVLAGEAVKGVDNLLRPLMVRIAAASTPDAVYDLLADSYPQLDDAALQALLGRAVFVSEVWGNLHA